MRLDHKSLESLDSLFYAKFADEIILKRFTNVPLFEYYVAIANRCACLYVSPIYDGRRSLLSAIRGATVTLP